MRLFCPEPILLLLHDPPEVGLALPGHSPNFAFKGKQRASVSCACEESCYCLGLFSLPKLLQGGTCQCLPWQGSKAQARDALQLWHTC